MRRVFGTGKLGLHTVQAEAVVHALPEHAARALLAIDHGHASRARTPRARSRRHARRAAADDDHVEAVLNPRGRTQLASPHVRRRVPRVRFLRSLTFGGAPTFARKLDVVGAGGCDHPRPRKPLVDRIGCATQLARHDFHKLRRTKAAMAAPHRSARAPLDCIERERGKRAMQCAHHFRLGHLAAAADHMPERRIARDSTFALLVGHGREGKLRRAARIKRRIAARTQASRNLRGDEGRNRRSRRQARRFEAGDVEEPGRIRRLADDEVARFARRAQPCEVRDSTAGRSRRPGAARAFDDVGKPLLRRRKVGLGCLGN